MLYKFVCRNALFSFVLSFVLLLIANKCSETKATNPQMWNALLHLTMVLCASRASHCVKMTTRFRSRRVGAQHRTHTHTHTTNARINHARVNFSHIKCTRVHVPNSTFSSMEIKRAGEKLFTVDRLSLKAAHNSIVVATNRWCGVSNRWLHLYLINAHHFPCRRILFCLFVLLAVLGHTFTSCHRRVVCFKTFIFLWHKILWHGSCVSVFVFVLLDFSLPVMAARDQRLVTGSPTVCVKKKKNGFCRRRRACNIRSDSGSIRWCLLLHVER